MILKNETIKRVVELLRSSGVMNQELLEELTDHFLCRIEMQIAEGDSYNDAVDDTMNLIVKSDLKAINRQTFFIHHKNKILMTSMTVLILMFSSLFLLNNQEPPELIPVKSATLEDITDGFGQRMHPIQKVKRFHDGIDIKAKSGTLIIAPESATVIETGFDKLDGYYIVLKHDEIFSTKYCHLGKVMVNKDEKVKKGQDIGTVGNSGASTGPHLHYEVFKNNELVDPLDYMGA